MAPTFQLGGSGYQYRALRLTDPLQFGWDVYALQTGLNGLRGVYHEALYEDGWLGVRTAERILDFQVRNSLEEDGIAGVVTQRVVALKLAAREGAVHDIPAGLLKGQLEYESSYWLGNHTAPYGDGSRDCGVAQRNTRYAGIEACFNTAMSVAMLAATLKTKWTAYAKVADNRRRWELAAGSWNRPAYTDALANGQTSVLVGGVRIDLSPGAPEREWIERYIREVTAYVRW